jgi:hypothetical protein
VVKIQKLGQSGVVRVEVPLWKETKSPKVRVWFGPNRKVGKVKVGHFVEKKGLKVKVYEMKFKKDKLG